MKPYFFSFYCLLFLIVSCETKEPRPLSLSPVFSDHMVLQQNDDVAIWGQFTPGEQVSILGSWGVESSTQANADGNWETTISTPDHGGPFTISITTQDSTSVINDVLIGEVWLASGQSNMEMPLKGWPPNDLINNSEEEISKANNPAIRMFTVPRNLSGSPIEEYGGTWVLSNRETAGNFSASAYFFAKRLHEELNVPVGIIHTSWGGTPAEAWTSGAKLKELGDFNETIDMLEDPQSQAASENWFAQFESVAFPQSEEEWANLSFVDLAMAGSEESEEGYQSISFPGPIEAVLPNDFDGAVWVRKSFIVENPDLPYLLNIGSVDDMDAVFINGEKIGQTMGFGFWNTPREYSIPAGLLKTGENLIAIRVIDTGGPGSINGPIEIASNDLIISLEGDWKITPITELYNGSFYVYTKNTSISSRPQVAKFNSNLPTVLFNAMINPLVPYTIKGFIWYQGESNVGRAQQYSKLFPLMIEDWRGQWKKELPFYFVQIAPYQYTQEPSNQISQELRESQRLTLGLPKTGMVVTMDIGNFSNIHPGNKQDVGQRLAGLALDNDYDLDLISSGPIYKNAVREGSKLIVSFEFAESGLVLKDNLDSEFEIAGEDKEFITAKVEINGNKLEVWSDEISSPVHVRYGWSDMPMATLFNNDGLPASSFSSDRIFE